MIILLCLSLVLLNVTDNNQFRKRYILQSSTIYPCSKETSGNKSQQDEEMSNDGDNLDNGSSDHASSDREENPNREQNPNSEENSNREENDKEQAVYDKEKTINDKNRRDLRKVEDIQDETEKLRDLFVIIEKLSDRDTVTPEE